MNSLGTNVLLAVTWALMTGQVTADNLLIGFALGYVILLFSGTARRKSAYHRRVAKVIGFTGFFVWDLILASLRVAHDVVTPREYMRPGVVAVPLDVHTDEQITLLANLITLTPGTLSLDVSQDRTVLYVHAMFLGDPDEFRRQVKHNYERRILELFQ